MTADRLRRAVLIVVLAGWTATVVAYLVQGKLPDPTLLGVPPGAYLLLYPPIPGRSGSGGDSAPAVEPPPPTPPAAPPAPTSGGAT